MYELIQNLLQAIADHLRPTCTNATKLRIHPNDLLRFLIVVAIVLLSGPEVLLAADMIAVLDLLGVALFLTAFGVGYKIVGHSILASLQKFFLPTQWTTLIRSRNYSLVAYGALRIGLNALTVFAINVGVFRMVKDIV